jgi:hypothetical protein
MSHESEGVDGNTWVKEAEGNKRIGWFPLEDDGNMILRNIGNRSLNDTASYSESLQS